MAWLWLVCTAVLMLACPHEGFRHGLRAGPTWNWRQQPQQQQPRDLLLPPLFASIKTSLVPRQVAELPKDMDPRLVQLNRLLVDLWDKIAFPTTATDDSDTVFRLKDYGLSRGDIKGFLKHFQVCKDCAADGAFLMATRDAQGDDVLQLSNVDFPLTVEEDSDDDWGLFDKSLLGDEANQVYVPSFPAEPLDDVVMADTKEWVRRVIADFNVCPFTVNPERAGIPMGGVRYTVSRALSSDEAFLRFWEEVYALFSSSEKDMATVLLVFPEHDLFGNFELFEQFCESLNDALCMSSMCMESQIQLVFFHPTYSFRDGQARSTSEAGAANFARRGPWPMINILRTPQVQLAQKGIPTGQVYKQNEERLNEVGAVVLEKMLYNRDWNGLPVHSSTATARIIRETALKEQEELEAARSSASETPGVCPFPHAAALQSPATPPPPPPSPSPLPPAQQAIGQSASTLKQLMDGPTEAQKSEDLLRLADEIEKWMAAGGI